MKKINFTDWRSALILILLLGGIVYANSLNSPFQFDDYDFIINNPRIEKLPSLKKFFLSPGRKTITYITFALNYRYSRLNPFFYHLVNLIFHAGVCFLLFLVVKLLFLSPGLRNSENYRYRKKIALASALIFLVHPIQTQAVTYIWQRSEVLAAFFYLLAYLTYLLCRQRRNGFYLVLTLILFYFGLSAKETILSLPIMIFMTEMLIFDKIKLKNHRNIIKYQKAWLVVLIILSFSIFCIFLSSRRYQTLISLLSDGDQVKTYFFTQLRVILTYIRLLFLPVNQTVDYSYTSYKTFFDLGVIFSFWTLVFIVGYAFLFKKNNRLRSFSIFFFFIALIPTSSFIPLPTVIFEHRIYLATAGFAIFISSLIFKHLKTKTALSLLIYYIVLLSVLTVFRNQVWNSQISLMKDAIKKSGSNPRAHLILGSVYYQLGFLKDASKHYKKAIILDDSYSEAYNNLGLIANDSNNQDAAREFFLKAIESDKNLIDPYINLANLYLEADQIKSAQQLLNEAKKIKNSRYSYNLIIALGNLAEKKGALFKAARHFRRAIKRDSQNYKLYFNLGNVYFRLNKYQKAIESYKKSLTLNEGDKDILYNLGLSYYEAENYSAAVDSFLDSLNFGKKDRAIYLSLANSYHKLGKYELADKYAGYAESVQAEAVK